MSATRAAAAVVPIDWVPIDQAGDVGWSEPNAWSFARALDYVLPNDSEILQISHFLPIMIMVRGLSVGVVALLDPAYQDVKVVGQGGQWLTSYVPIALRCMPFALPDPGSGETSVRVATNIRVREPGDEPDGDRFAQRIRVLRTLNMIETGQKRLAVAAEQLLLSGLCAKIAKPGEEDSLDGYYTVDPARFRTLPNLAFSIAAKENFLALDLAGVCLFSSRLLNRRLTRHLLGGEASQVMPSQGRDLDALVRSVAPIPVRLDEDFKLDIVEVLSPKP